MNANPGPGRIVVGYDGSYEARQAVHWAAAEAERTGAPLQIVNAYQITWPGAYYPAVAEQLEAAQEVSEQRVGEIADRIRGLHSGLEVTGLSVDTPAAATLLDLGDAGAKLLVVGNRGAGGLTNLVMGSIGQQVATHSRVPVAVVRGRCAVTEGPVVVGVDGSASSADALGLAFTAARARGVELLAVRAYVTPAYSPLPRAEVEAVERTVLDAGLAPWREQYPDVKVEALVAGGSAAKVLTGLSHTAQLVVVGSRGHGGFAGLLLGSVGLQLMHHAECPVLIAHASPAG
ncbi:universal stress protein [Dactylosporangium vinaceum]|uniref:Universal stress protein n=1 Tax=Dactylosporangium vinaceum TaxID=53362 RepID=A0ABV5MAJ2_9ACTN|nr:universal stress protein [Dactylosporangium vinaceum]UAB92967.1 universal stress protein [Dactylosporangium vinaceum]